MPHNRQPIPVILSQPHGGLALPEEVQEMMAIQHIAIYNDCDLWIEQLFDFGHADLVDQLPPDAPSGVLASVSTAVARALVDANRLPTDLAHPDGPIKSHTSYGVPIYHQPLTIDQQQTLLDRYWWEFHHRLEAALDEFGGQAKLLLDCHNMAQRGPAAYQDKDAIRPLICVANMGDERGESLVDACGKRLGVSCEPALIHAAAELAAEIFGDLRLLSDPDGRSEAQTVAINSPFRGGYILGRHIERMEANVEADLPTPPALMIEVNRGLFVGDQAADSPVKPPNLERIDDLRARLYEWTVRFVMLL